MSTIRRVLWSSPHLSFLQSMLQSSKPGGTGRGEPPVSSSDVLYQTDDRVHKFSFDESYFSEDDASVSSAIGLCTEADTTCFVFAPASWIPASMPRPVSMKHFPNVVVYEYAEGVCLVLVHYTTNNAKELNALMMTLTSILRAMAAETAPAFSQHPLTKYLRSAGYLLRNHAVDLVIRVTEDTTPDECLKMLRFAQNTFIPEDVPPISPIKRTSSPTKSPLKKGTAPFSKSSQGGASNGNGSGGGMQQHFDPAAVEQVKHENVELQDLVVKMAAQIQQLHQEKSTWQESSRSYRVGLGGSMLLQEKYDDLLKKTKEMEKRETQRMRAQILQREVKQHTSPAPPTHAHRVATASPSGPLIGPSDEVKAKVKQQAAMIAQMKKRMAQVESELLQVKKQEKEREEKGNGNVATMACDVLQQKAESLEDHCVKLGAEQYSIERTNYLRDKCRTCCFSAAATYSAENT